MSSDPPPRPVAREYLEALLIAVIFATFAKTYVFQAFKIPSESMKDNLLVGDHILVNKFIYGAASSPVERVLLPMREVRRGDVVVFRFPQDPSRDFIKRAVGLPDDWVQLVDKRLYVNGKWVADGSYASHTDPILYPRGPPAGSGSPRDNFGPVRVPADSYFCLGDNRDYSNDSRYWGMVPRSYLKGRALLIYWSFAEETDETDEPSGLGGRLQQISRVALNFLYHTRWGRTFRIVR
jgi:signal peptidase I